MKQSARAAMNDILDGDEVGQVLRDRFYVPPAAAEKDPKRNQRPAADHYQVICISLYREDLERLDAKVAELKRSGFRKMSRSAFIRFALDTADDTKLPKGY
ncbi:MAG: hypothetical protein MJD61_10265 [Proteobacteria bacterium]|nr:hypothetical protein [Pseudomonadota bacterium]